MMCTDTISAEEVAKRPEEVGYKEEAERTERIYGEVLLSSTNL